VNSLGDPGGPFADALPNFRVEGLALEGVLVDGVAVGQFLNVGCGGVGFGGHKRIVPGRPGRSRAAGAAIDVFDPEPPPADYPLLGFANVLLTPHMAARTHTAVENMSWVVRDVVDVLNGRPPAYPAP